MKKTILTITLYFLPTAILSSVGILILVFQRAGFDIVFGVLVLILAVVLLTGGILIQSVLRIQARRVRLQTDFVTKVSHELRTPLASIRMFVDTLQGGGLEDAEEKAMCLDVISTETSRLTKMIERLLTWGRMESGRKTFDRRPELVATLVGEALAQAESQLQTSGVEIELSLPEESAVVLADRHALVEALLNIISNAIKYGVRDENPCIRITVRTVKRRAHIEIADNGQGIPRCEQRHVFEKFYRGAAHSESHTQGSGLGLAMVYLIVKAHKGKIKLRSQPGEGACFIITLPAVPLGTSAMEVPPG